MGYVEVNGHRLYVQDTGGDGPPIVFSHGAGDDHEVFTAQVDDLRDVYRVLVWDQRAAGRAAPTGKDGDDHQLFTDWDAAHDLFGIMDDAGIERAVLAGAVEGSDVTLRAALLHPDRVRALILVDTEAPRDEDDISHRLDELAMPVLVVFGADDAALPAARAKALGVAVSDCRGIVAVGGAQSGSHRTHPAQVNPEIRIFLESLPA